MKPIQTLIFASDYSIPKPKKQDKRKSTFNHAEATNTVETYSKQNTNDGAFMGQSNAIVLNQQPSEVGDSTSLASLGHL